MTERIRSAAVRLNGVIHVDGGRTHFEKILHARRAGYRGRFEEGFVTSTGRFVGRCEAMDIAKREGQLRYPNNDYGSVLYSEDLHA